MALNDSAELIEQLKQLNQWNKQHGSASRLAGGAPKLSNTLDSDDIENIGKRFKQLDSQLKHNNSRFSEIASTVGKVVGANKNMTAQLNKAAIKIQEGTKSFSIDVKKVTDNTFALAKTMGAFDKAILGNLKTQATSNALLRESIKTATVAREEEEKNIALKERALVNLRKRGTNNDAAKKKKKEKDIKALTDKITSMREAMGALEKKVKKEHLAIFFEGLDKSSFVFQQLDDVTKGLITRGKFADTQLEDMIKIYEQINEVTTVHAKALRDNAEIGSQAAHEFKNNLLKVANMIKVGFKVALDYVDKSMDNFDAQLKNNVMESHYGAAMTMGMSDAQMSELLGAFQSETRNMAGNIDGSKVLDGGRLERLQEEVGYLYGLQAKDAAAKILQQQRDMRKIGVNATDRMAADNLKDMKGMAYAAALSTDELESFYSELGNTGTLQALAAKYDGKSAEEKRKAINADIGQILKHGQMMGYSRDQIKKQMDAANANRHNSYSDRIMKQISAGLEINQASENGASLTEQEQADYTLMRQTGRTTDAGLAAQQKMSGVNNDALQRGIDASANGDPSLLAKFDIMAGVINTIGGSDTTMSADRLDDANAATQSRTSQFGKENAAKILAGAAVEQDAYRTVDELKKLPNSLESFNSSLLIMEGELKNAKDMIMGVKANPAYSGLESVATAGGSFLLNSVLQKIAGDALLGGGGAGGGGILGRVSNLLGGGKGVVSNLAKVGGGSVIKGAAGGMGLGIVGGLVEYGGDSMKADAIANGSRENGTILDKETAGATLSIAGSALQGAALGMLLGPEGAAIGGVIGAAKGMYDNWDTVESNWDDMFGTGTDDTLSQALQKDNADRLIAEQKAGEDPATLTNTYLANIAEHTKSTAESSADQTKAVEAQTTLEQARADKKAKVNSLLTSAQGGAGRVKNALG